MLLPMQCSCFLRFKKPIKQPSCAHGFVRRLSYLFPVSNAKDQAAKRLRKHCSGKAKNSNSGICACNDLPLSSWIFRVRMLSKVFRENEFQIAPLLLPHEDWNELSQNKIMTKGMFEWIDTRDALCQLARIPSLFLIPPSTELPCLQKQSKTMPISRSFPIINEKSINVSEDSSSLVSYSDVDTSTPPEASSRASLSSQHIPIMDNEECILGLQKEFLLQALMYIQRLKCVYHLDGALTSTISSCFSKDTSETSCMSELGVYGLSSSSGEDGTVHWPFKREEARVIIELIAWYKKRENMSLLALLYGQVHLQEFTRRKSFVRWLSTELKAALHALPSVASSGDIRSTCLLWLVNRIVNLDSYDNAKPNSGWITCEESSQKWLNMCTDCVCAASSTDLLTTDLTVARSNNQDIPPNALNKGGHATNTLRMPPFTEFATLFDSLHNSTSELSMTIGTESPTKSPFNNDVNSFSSEAALTFKHDANVHAAFELLRRLLIASDIPICPSFRIYWRCVLTEMLRSGWEAVAVLADSNPQYSAMRRQRTDLQMTKHSQKLKKDAEYYAVGVFLSFRRMLSAFGKHQLLKPLIELHELVVGYHCHTVGQERKSTFKAIASNHSDFTSQATWTSNTCIKSEKLRHFRDHAAAVRQDILSGKIASPLLWRELVLFDAFTLINLGHTSEKASDLWSAVREVEDDNVVGTAMLDALGANNSIKVEKMKPRPLQLRVQELHQHLMYLQEECLQHLAVLEASSSRVNTSMISSKSYSQQANCLRGMDFIVSKITPRTRAGMISRLKESLRLSTKVLLGLGDTASICALYRKHGSSIGGSWEAGKALVQEGAYDTALDAFQQLLRDTRGQYPFGLPRFIQDMILEAITGASNEIISGPDNEQRKETETVNRLMQRYEQLRSWSEGELLPAPLCLHALLKGASKGISSAVTVTLPLRAYVVSHFLMEYVSRYGARDGFLSRSIDIWIGCVLEARQVTGADSKLLEAMEQEFLRALVELLGRFPHLPITRISLTWFLRAGYKKGVHVVLCSLIASRALCSMDISGSLESYEHQSSVELPSSADIYLSDNYIQATLNSLSKRTLEELAEFLASDDITCAKADFLQLECMGAAHFEEMRFTRLKDMCTRTAQHCVLLQLQQRPWQCFLCRTWNSRHSTECKLCQALDVAVVQCARCNGFASTRDTACLVCGVNFTVGDDTMTRKETLGSEENTATLSAIGDGRSADAILYSTSFKAVFPLRVWTCHDCGRANDARHIFYCAFCSSQNAALQKTLTEESYTCSTCGYLNPQGMLRPWCGTCGTLSPVIPSDQKKELWYCPVCHHLNPWLCVHCERCTEGRPLPAPVPGGVAHSSFPLFADSGTSPTVLSSPFVTVLWDTIQCHACCLVNPLVARFCRGCGCELVIPSKVRKTIDSGLMEWMRMVFVSRPNYESYDKDECQISAERATRARTASNLVTCSYCGCIQENSVDTVFLDQVLCRRCHACLPGSTIKIWVCLQSKCFHVNADFCANTETGSKGLTDGRMSNEGLRSMTEETTFFLCSGCHTLHHLVDVFHLYLNKSEAMPHPQPSPLSTSPLVQNGASDNSNPLGYRGELSNMRTAKALLFLPPISGPTQCCLRCGTYLEYTNLACVCPQCGTCQTNFVHKTNQLIKGQYNETLLPHTSPTKTILSGWFILFNLSQAASTVHRYQYSGEESEPVVSDGQRLDQPNKAFSPRDDPAWILDFMRSAVSALRSTQEDLLPWRGCDLQNRMLCGVEPRVVVLDNDMESLHSAIFLIRHIIENLCLVAKSFSGSRGIKDSMFSECLESDAVWEKQRPWLLVAGDLVDIVNTTTDFDEIGFPVLSNLCQLIRPHEIEHIQSETRWLYLHAMKLTREAMTHEVVCARCFGRHDKDEACCF